VGTTAKAREETMKNTMFFKDARMEVVGREMGNFSVIFTFHGDTKIFPESLDNEIIPGIYEVGYTLEEAIIYAAAVGGMLGIRKSILL
jgi:hypothetical protein